MNWFFCTDLLQRVIQTDGLDMLAELRNKQKNLQMQSVTHLSQVYSNISEPLNDSVKLFVPTAEKHVAEV